ncbi:hypothetical protein [Helicobacter sp. 11S02629-2]|uniref:hypothetical protein n=1 Tax=Helicobacter sp. 11S02629-2 TaxID=1476195 RepID=UPI000BA761E1|nr:hypothetical protein [Helicobacter sp. 11S02629-2]PAF44645.1 hypothetical protein BKH40_05300 [Helicobacter sp. 11S02629-2]
MKKLLFILPFFILLQTVLHAEGSNMGGNDINFGDDTHSYDDLVINPKDYVPLQHSSKEVDLKSEFINARVSIVKRSGKFIGVSIGTFPFQPVNSKDTNYPIALGIYGGVITYLNNAIGVRGYLKAEGALHNIAFINNAAIHEGYTVSASLGLDFFTDFRLDNAYSYYVGLITGFGLATLYHKDTQNHVTLFRNGVIVQGGISFTLAYKHRIEVLVKLLPVENSFVSTTALDYSGSIGYSYIF